MINTNQIATQLARMPDQALQQFAFMHKDDPYSLAMALSESNRRKEMRMGAQAVGGQPQPKVVDQAIQEMAPPQVSRQLPEEQGIGALPVPNMQRMADGGIVGYAGGKEVKAEDPLAQYEPMIRAEAKRQGIDPEVAMRLFRQESGGNKSIVSSKGATGLGQLMAAAAEEMGIKPEERTDPAKNIQASIGYFKKQLNRFGTYDKAAAAYNWGPGNLEKHIAKSIKKNQDFRVGLPRETAKYLTSVVPVPSARADDGTAASSKNKPPVVASQPATTPLGGRDVPGSPEAIAYQEQLKAQRGPEKSYLRQRGEELLGAPEALLSLGSGAAAVMGAGQVRAGIDRLLGGKMSVNEGVDRMTFSPRSDVGKESLSQAHRALEDFKIPPFIPGVTTSRSRPRSPEAVRAAEAAAQKAAIATAKADAAQASAARRSGPAQGELFTKEQAPIPKKPAAKTPLNEAMQKAVEDNRRAEQMSLFTEAEAPVPSALDRVLKKRDPALEAAQSAAEKRARGAEDVRSAREAVEKRQQLEANREALKAKERAKKAQDEAGAKDTEVVKENILDDIDRRYDTEQAARVARVRSVLPTAVRGANVEPTYPGVTSQGPWEEDFTAPETNYQPEAPATAEVPIEERSRMEPKAEAKKGFGFSDEDLLMLGLTMMSGESPYATQNIGKAGIATLSAKKEREKYAAEQAQRDIMGQYYKTMTSTLGTSPEERMIERMQKDPSYAAAIEKYQSAKWAPRTETTERDFMKQYEALTKANPTFGIDNPDAAVWVQNQMRTRGLTAGATPSFTSSSAKFLGYE